MKDGGSYIYILTNKTNTVLYVGVTSNLSHRLYQHRTGVFKDSFTSRYNISKLVYFEYFLTIEDAIQREKQLKLAQDKKRLN